MKKRLVILTAVALMTGSGYEAFAQGRYTHTDLQPLDECRTLFTQYDFSAAGTLLDEWYKSNQGTEETEYMKTVIAAERDLNNALPVINLFLDKYPTSIFANRVWALKGSAYFAGKEYEKAIEAFDEADPMLLSERDCNRLVRHNAISLIRSGRVQEGYVQLSILDQLVQNPESDGDLIFYHAYVDYMNGKTEQAKAGFEKAIGTAHENEARLYLAQIELNGDGDYKSVYATGNSLLVNSNEPELQHEAERLLGEYFYKKGDYSMAADLLTSYLASDSSADMRYDQYLLGMSHFQSDDMDRAIECLAQIAEGTDDIAQSASLHVGLAYLKKGEKNLARMAFERASDIPGQPDIREQALYNYAMTVVETAYSPFAESVTSFERFLNEFPDSKYADKISDYLIDTYLSTTNYDAALASIDKIKSPSSQVMASKVTLLYRKAMDLFVAGEYKEVPHILTNAIELSRYDSNKAIEATFWRGEAYYRLGEGKRAESDYLRYLDQIGKKKTENSALANYGLGYIEYDRQAYEKASRYLRTVIDNAKTTKVKSDILADACVRAGDCMFYTRQYNQAKDYYDKALGINENIGDYILYQTAIVNGLQRKYADKIKNLDRLTTEYPASTFVAAALYEQGRAYQQIDKQKEAIGAFQKIQDEFPQSDLARKAAAEMALIYYQTGKYDEAIAAYKDVVKRYPGSDEAQTAMADLKSIYVDKGDVNSYFDFTQTVPGAAPIAVSERDSLTYVAAEGLFSRGDKKAALDSFTEYLKQYPNGAFAVNAWYYQGLLLEEVKNYDSAFNSFMQVAEFENSRFCESAIDHAALMAWQLEDFDTALETYIRLYEKTTDVERQRRSLYSIICSAGKIEEYNVILKYADKALKAGLTQSQHTEVSYWKAKSLLNTGSGADARPILEELSKDTRSLFGAESDYLLGQYLFDNGEAAEAERITMEFIKEGTPHMYWLARSFILLSDIYKSQGKDIEARQYLLSLKSNYTADDDIAGMIAKRLE